MGVMALKLQGKVALVTGGGGGMGGAQARAFAAQGAAVCVADLFLLRVHHRPAPFSSSPWLNRSPTGWFAENAKQTSGADTKPSFDIRTLPLPSVSCQAGAGRQQDRLLEERPGRHLPFDGPTPDWLSWNTSEDGELPEGAC
jgi:hypothetical protein